MSTAPALQDIDAETQIFTPPYVAKFLAQNSLARLWINSHPHSGLADRMGRYVASENPVGLARVDSPEEIRVIDPACGTGNLLIAAYDVLYDIYLDAKYKPRDIPGLILSKNVMGVDIDPAAAGAARAILTAKAHEKDSHFFRRQVTPNVHAVTEADHPDAGTYGMLLRDLDHTKYHVVIANPPYMGSKHFTPEMRRFSKEEYPDSARDLCTMFIERGLEMVVPGGMIAMLTAESWMFLASYEQMRRRLLKQCTIVSMAHLGRGVFGSEASVASTAFIQANVPADGYQGVYFRLTESKHKDRDLHTQILNYRLAGYRPEIPTEEADHA